MESRWCSYCAKARYITREQNFIICTVCGKLSDADMDPRDECMYNRKLLLSTSLATEGVEGQSTTDITDAIGLQSDSDSDIMDSDDDEEQENEHGEDNTAEGIFGADADIYYGSEEEDEDEYDEDEDFGSEH